MTGCWNEDTLFENREEIVALFTQSEQLREQCCRFLAAAAALMEDSRHLAELYTNHGKILRFAKRFCDRELRPVSETPGKESIRFLSAVTDEGLTFFAPTAAKLAQRLVLVEDDYGASSGLLLEVVRSRALTAGYSVISCYCPLDPYNRLEHLFIPALSLGLVTANRFHQPTDNPWKVVNYRRFTDLEGLKAHKRRLTFARKAAQSMLEQSVHLLVESKEVHDKLEGRYMSAMDYDETTSIVARVVDRLETIAARQTPLPSLDLKRLGR